MFMYNGYASYDSEVQKHIVCNSPLSSNVPLAVAEEIAKPYLKHINELIITNRPFSIATDKDFKWTLEVFAFGFTCEESSIYQLCANIYVEWLKVFEETSINLNSIPPILREKSEFYWSQMFWHLYHLFVIHDEKTADLSTKQLYTHKVLRQLQTIISRTELSLNLWHILLQVFLAIGDTVLSPPYRKNDEGTAVLSYRLVPSIYQVFMVAVGKVNIPPGLWRTFRDYTVTWRHRPAVIYDWAQLTCVLTSTVVHKLWCPELTPLHYVCTETDQGDYIQKIIDSLPLDVLIITWIKFLTILQNPSDCGDVSVFLRMPNYANHLQGSTNIKLRDITSLQELPRIFVNVTNAIEMFVHIWLGKDVDPSSLYSPKPFTNSTGPTNDNTSTASNIPSQARPFNQSIRGNSAAVPQSPTTGTLKTTKSTADVRRVSTAAGQIVPSVSTPVNTVVPLPTSQQTISAEKSIKVLRANRPTVNSLMHLYGPWILDACLLQMKDRSSRSTIVANTNDLPRMNDIDKTLDAQNERFMDEAFAKSFATICSIFSSSYCDEFIHQEYLSRFYYALQQGLRLYHGDEQRSQAIMESILLNSSDLFRINLSGINILLPLYLDAIELYLQSDFQKYVNHHPNIKGAANLSSARDRFIRIRFNCIQILMSIVSLPFHFEHLQQKLFEDYMEKSHDVQTTSKTFLQYRLKIFPLLLFGLQYEQDITNAQLLFGTIRLGCSLSAHYEQQHRKTEEKDRKDLTAEYASESVLLICDKGTNDSQLFLAALDTLISFLTDPICHIPIDIWKKVLKRLCTFIDTQLHLGPKNHTREMHSTCVATYNTLITLIIERPMLLDDVENLYELCQIIELGISGEKAKSSEKVVNKKNKEHRPASQRVAEVAEYLMCVLFEHKNLSRITDVSQRSMMGACKHAEDAGETLNEEAVLHLKNDICRNWLDETTFANSVESTKFKYFAVNGNSLFAIAELPISVNNGMPAIILLCRGLFGKNIWTLNFRYNPNSNVPVHRNKSNERMMNENDKHSPSSSHSQHDHKEKLVLSYSTRNERTKSELSIPTLSSVVKRDEANLNLFRTLKTKQIKIEDNAMQRTNLMGEKKIPECRPPECQKHFESIRLFLSHYGFCSLDSMHRLLNGKSDSKVANHLQPSIRLLDSNPPAFMTDIKTLDRISPTLYCTGQIFYLKKNQNTIDESFLNMKTPEQLNPSFLTMVSQFGSVVEVQRHCGWTGNADTSWKTVSTAQSNKSPPSKALENIDGADSILYWVDLTTEMAFYLPQNVAAISQTSELRILIVWLEEFRSDLDSILPAQDLQSKGRDISIIGIHPLKNRLFRILLNSNAQRMQSACASIPLIDGMVLPLQILPIFLRQAVYNLSRRKRLEDSQNSQSAYLNRKVKIRKIIDTYQNRTNEKLDGFFQDIFFSSSMTNKQQPIVTQTRPRTNSMISVQS